MGYPGHARFRFHPTEISNFLSPSLCSWSYLPPDSLLNFLFFPVSVPCFEAINPLERHHSNAFKAFFMEPRPWYGVLSGKEWMWMWIGCCSYCFDERWLKNECLLIKSSLFYQPFLKSLCEKKEKRLINRLFFTKYPNHFPLLTVGQNNQKYRL